MHKPADTGVHGVTVAESPPAEQLPRKEEAQPRRKGWARQP